MNIARIFTDSEGGSHFELIPILMEEQSGIGYFSSPITNMKSMRFQKIVSSGDWDFHTTVNALVSQQEMLSCLMTFRGKGTKQRHLRTQRAVW